MLMFVPSVENAMSTTVEKMIEYLFNVLLFFFNNLHIKLKGFNRMLFRLEFKMNEIILSNKLSLFNTNKTTHSFNIQLNNQLIVF